MHKYSALLGARDIKSPGTRVTGNCDTPNVDVKNQIQVIFKSDTHAISTAFSTHLMFEFVFLIIIFFFSF